MAEKVPPAIQLGQDEAEFTLRTGLQRLPCTIVMEAGPLPELIFRIVGVDFFAVFGERQTLSVHLINANIEFTAFISSNNGDYLSLSPTRTPLVVGNSSHLDEVHFDLINFPSFWRQSPAPVRVTIDELDIETADWFIQVRPRRTSPDIVDFHSSLFSITHSCVIRRHNGEVFSSEDSQEVLNALHDLFSFAAGCWVAPIFVRGICDEQVVWEEWGTRPLHSALARVDTWFDVRHGNALAEVLPGILDLRKDPEKLKTFHSAVYWYLRSSDKSAGVDGGLILMQAALELLSWQLFVVDRKAISGNGFRKLPAEDQIRLLVESVGIPVEIPRGLADLRAKAKELNWSDGPKALAEVRNKLVHPAPNGTPLPYYDAWRLARWYLELLLLRITGFRGEYSNRTRTERWRGTVDPVPWAVK